MKAFIHTNIKTGESLNVTASPFIVVTVGFCIEKLQSMAGNSSSYVGNHYFILACSVCEKKMAFTTYRKGVNEPI